MKGYRRYRRKIRRISRQSVKRYKRKINEIDPLKPKKTFEERWNEIEPLLNEWSKSKFKEWLMRDTSGKEN